MTVPVVGAPFITPPLSEDTSLSSDRVLEFFCPDKILSKKDLTNLNKLIGKKNNFEEVDIDFSNTEWTKETIAMLEDLLINLSCKKKMRIDLQGSDFPREMAQTLAKIALSHRCEIVLNLRETCFTPGDVGVLVEGLITRGKKTGEYLGGVTLKLDGNSLGDAGVVELSYALDQLYCDVKVSLCDNGIGDMGGRAIAEGLKNHKGLNQVRIDLWNNPLSQSSLRALMAAKALPNNSVIHPRLLKGFVAGIQLANEGEVDLFQRELRQMQQEGKGVLKEIDQRQGHTFSVFEFTKESDYPGIILVCQGLQEGVENITTGSLLMAQGRDGCIVPQIVIGVEGAGGGNSFHLLRGLANADSGTVVNGEFKPSSVVAWNPLIGVHEKRHFFFSDEDLLESAKEAFEKYKNSTREQNKGDLRITESLGLSGDIQWEEPWKGRVKKAFNDLLQTELADSQSPNMAVTGAKAAACAKVFFERGIPFATVKCPQSKMSVDFLWNWLSEITKEKIK